MGSHQFGGTSCQVQHGLLFLRSRAESTIARVPRDGTSSDYGQERNAPVEGAQLDSRQRPERTRFEMQSETDRWLGVLRVHGTDENTIFPPSRTRDRIVSSVLGSPDKS